MLCVPCAKLSVNPNPGLDEACDPDIEFTGIILPFFLLSRKISAPGQGQNMHLLWITSEHCLQVKNNVNMSEQYVLRLNGLLSTGLC